MKVTLETSVGDFERMLDSAYNTYYDSTRKQTLLFEHLGWEYPEAVYWGRVMVHECGGLSTWEMRASIESGSHGGWDDLRLPTLKTLRRRGFSAQALRDFWIDLGLTQKDISISRQTIEAFNSSLIDSTVERRRFVASPVTLELQGGGEGERVLAPKHPDGAVPGSREWRFTGSIAIQASDLRSGRVRLKEFADIEISGCLLYTSPSPRDGLLSRMPSSA